MPVFGKWEKASLRDCWPHETDFTYWLADKDNIVFLEQAIEKELTVEDTEVYVGPFRADILCKDTQDETLLIVEAQYGWSDHSHLGQLQTYGAGLQAHTLVWIAEDFEEKHLATLHWWNQITDKRFSFFALQIELWRIDGSNPAPRFNVLCKPNDWIKTGVELTNTIEDNRDELSPVEQHCLDYWKAFLDYLRLHNTTLRFRKPKTEAWMEHKIHPLLYLGVLFSVQKAYIEVYIQIEDKAIFHRLHADSAEIHREVGATLNWEEQPGKQTSSVYLDLLKQDFSTKEEWENQHSWLKEKAEAICRSFVKRIGIGNDAGEHLGAIAAHD